MTSVAQSEHPHDGTLLQVAHPGLPTAEHTLVIKYSTLYLTYLGTCQCMYSIPVICAGTVYASCQHSPKTQNKVNAYLTTPELKTRSLVCKRQVGKEIAKVSDWHAWEHVNTKGPVYQNKKNTLEGTLDKHCDRQPAHQWREMHFPFPSK